ncbi:MAG: sulfatase-like hydrolase/transferase [Armatimonadetes bacterium]|nr:sulfatase-like hydrolase/transferase [Armatimonadota bacterium]
MNVVLILADQLSACWLEGAAAACPTPHLDGLARRGMRFHRHIVHNPVCMPSRASLFTGRSSRVHGVLMNGYELGSDCPTFPQVLQRAGVHTAGFGKFHLQCHHRSAHNDVRQYGFDVAEVTEDIRAGDWLDWVARAHPDCYEQALATVWPVPCLRQYGPERINLLPRVQAARTQHPPQAVAPLTWSSVVPEHCCQTRWIGDRACAYLQSAAEPFFLTVSFVDPHDPYDPPASYLRRVDAAQVPAPIPPTWPEDPRSPALFRRVSIRELFAGLDEAAWRQIRAHYLASVAFIDDQVGRVLATLTARGLDDRTVVLFTSDHGDMLGDHGLPFKGAWHYDACIRTPLLAAGPGIVPGECPALIESLDLFPTVLELAGVTCKTPVEGRSLVPWLRGEPPADWRDAAYTESYASYSDRGLDGWARTLRTAEWRYTLFAAGGGEQLFHLAEDPQERVNRAGDPACAAVRAELRDQLLERLIAQEHPFPPRGLFGLGTH